MTYNIDEIKEYKNQYDTTEELFRIVCSIESLYMHDRDVGNKKGLLHVHLSALLVKYFHIDGEFVLDYLDHTTDNQYTIDAKLYQMHIDDVASKLLDVNKLLSCFLYKIKDALIDIEYCNDIDNTFKQLSDDNISEYTKKLDALKKLYKIVSDIKAIYKKPYLADIDKGKISILFNKLEDSINNGVLNEYEFNMVSSQIIEKMVIVILVMS